MSARRSSAHDDVEAAREAAERALGSSPVSSDPSFTALREARIGTPALVHSPEGQPAFWLVPFVRDDLACGYAQVEFSLTVSRIATFGASPADRASWPEASFFDYPLQSVLREIRAAYPGATFSAPLLSYHCTPARWGWLLHVFGPRDALVLITPGSWSEMPPPSSVRGFE